MNHLYLHKADARKCAESYRSGQNVQVLTAEIAPPLAVLRRGDVWCVLDPEAKVLFTFASSEDARKAAGQRALCLLSAPVRQAMPVQNGPPHFG